MSRASHSVNTRLRHGKATSFVQTATQDRTIHAQIVACPTCKAEIGVKCSTSNGGTGQHQSRRRMAIRAMNEDYMIADVEHARGVAPRLRQAILQADPTMTAPELAALTGVTSGTLRGWQHGRANPSGPGGAAYGAYLREARARLAKELNKELHRWSENTRRATDDEEDDDDE